MPSRIAIFCDKILEVGWLAALITAPLFFNVYSSRVFEPDKITLLRSIALLMAGAWIIRQVERASSGRSLRTWLKENPLALPTLGIVFVNVLSTIFSLAPSVSLWGSYQRLQGLDTTLSYIAIFFLAASTLRTRAQFDRAINTAILTSFPIAYYGVIQHYKLDPLPWGGDTSSRVAANMGNSIFVAAYLIMVVPLSLARWVEILTRVTHQSASRWVGIGISAFAVAALAVVWTIDFWAGVVFAGSIAVGMVVYAVSARANRRDFLLVAVYSVHLAVLLVAIFFTQSRGPWLGLAGGLFAFALLYALVRGTRKFVMGSIALAVVGVIFLTAFNLPSSPLDSLKKVPYVGRLGNILETESGTGKVRELIWQGDVPLILPHAPLWSPTTGDDALNLLRPLIGYGPEAMYVAYNPFYPPDLAHREARNASPDRSHNETFDSLVTTGLFGFVAYIFLFISVFYFGLKSLGMIESTGQRNAFVALWLGGGFVSALVFGLWRGWNFLGVALPFGMIMGFFIFLVADALRAPSLADVQRRRTSDALWITALLAAFIGHFIEINFGIAIVSTRTYFWFYAALLVIVGMNRIQENEPQTTPAAAPPPAQTPARTPEPRISSRRQRRARTAVSTKTSAPREGSLSETLTWTFVCSIVFITLAYEFITSQPAAANPVELLMRSLFVKDGNPSYAIFSIIAVTWMVAGILGYDPRLQGESRWLSIAIFAVLSFTITMWFVLFQTRWLFETLDQRNNAIDRFTYLLALYYVFLFLLLLAAAYAQWSEAARESVVFARTSANLVLMPLTLLTVIVMIYMTNFTAIVGDVLYKVGTSLDNAGIWNQSIGVYETALQLQPDQDFYLLFLGRAYLEAARTTQDVKQRTQLLQVSEQRLLRARQLNPLNTDHSANLARLNRIWATMSDSPTERSTRLQKSSDYYRDATRLSPNTAHLYNEWSQVYLIEGDIPNTRAMLDKSLSLDQEFAQTYQYLGDLANSQRDDARAMDAYIKAIQQDPNALTGPDGLPLTSVILLFSKPENASRVIEAYRAAALKNPDSMAPNLAIAEIYKRTGQLDLARKELEQAVQRNPQDLNVNLALVNFLSTNGFIDPAIESMKHVLEIVPPSNSDYARMQDFNSQLLTLQKAMEAVRKAPTDLAAHRTLAAMWRSRGQPQFALPEYQAIVRLAPSDYDGLKGAALMNLVLGNADDTQRGITAAAASAPDKEKTVWQNLQSALNNQRTQQIDKAVKDAQAAAALAVDADQAVIQTYVSQLQSQTTATGK